MRLCWTLLGDRATDCLTLLVLTNILLTSQSVAAFRSCCRAVQTARPLASGVVPLLYLCIAEDCHAPLPASHACLCRAAGGVRKERACSRTHPRRPHRDRVGRRGRRRAGIRRRGEGTDRVAPGFPRRR